MSMIGLIPNDQSSPEEILNHCVKICGLITTNEDYRYFALICSGCNEKFLQFDKYIEHIQLRHLHHFTCETSNCTDESQSKSSSPHKGPSRQTGGTRNDRDQSMVVKEEQLIQNENNLLPSHPENDGTEHRLAAEQQQQQQQELTHTNTNPSEFAVAGIKREEEHSFESNPLALIDRDLILNSYLDSSDNSSESPPQDSSHRVVENCHDVIVDHWKNRKLIRFLITAYKRHPFLWDQRHALYRDSIQEKYFLSWLSQDIQRRFNACISAEAVQKEWDKLCSVFRQESQRMRQDESYVSDLWFIKCLQFLSKPGYHNSYEYQQLQLEEEEEDDVSKSTNRCSVSLWSDFLTSRLITLLIDHPCVYTNQDDKQHDHRNKEEHSTALQEVTQQLCRVVKVTTAQVSKRVAQLRSEYSRQKLERLLCERAAHLFLPTFLYYDQLSCMDAEVPPFRCKQCPIIATSPREMEDHCLSHKGRDSSPTSATTVPSNSLTLNGNMRMVRYKCPFCAVSSRSLEMMASHLQTHCNDPNNGGDQIHSATNESCTITYQCQLCTSQFQNKILYEDHLQQTHRIENYNRQKKNWEVRGKTMMIGSYPAPRSRRTNPSDSLSSSMAKGRIDDSSTSDKQRPPFKCNFEKCKRVFVKQRAFFDHYKRHFLHTEFTCDVCGKIFKFVRNLQNHKQIHEPIKKYVCQMCGAAFAQAAGLYLHKRRHTRNALKNRTGP